MNQNIPISRHIILPYILLYLNITNYMSNLQFGQLYFLNIPNQIQNYLVYIIQTAKFTQEQIRVFIELLLRIKASPLDYIAKIEMIIYERERLYVVYEKLKESSAIEQSSQNEAKQIALKQIHDLLKKVLYNYPAAVDNLTVYDKDRKIYHLQNYNITSRVDNIKRQTLIKNNKIIKEKEDPNEGTFANSFIGQEKESCEEPVVEEENPYERQIQMFQFQGTQ